MRTRHRDKVGRRRTRRDNEGRHDDKGGRDATTREDTTRRGGRTRRDVEGGHGETTRENATRRHHIWRLTAKKEGGGYPYHLPGSTKIMQNIKKCNNQLVGWWKAGQSRDTTTSRMRTKQSAGTTARKRRRKIPLQKILPPTARVTMRGTPKLASPAGCSWPWTQSAR